MKKNWIIILGFIMIACILFIIIVNGRSKSSNNDFLNNIQETDYVEVSYGNIKERLDATLATLINESSVVEHKKEAMSADNSATQPFYFVLYSDNDTALYRIVFTEKENQVSIFREVNSKLEDYDITDETVLSYLESESQKIYKEYINNM